MTTNQDARAAFEARYKSDANDPANAADLALFVAGFESAEQRAVPAGFVMVPVEPTPEMLRAGSHSVNMNYHYGTLESISRHAHAAMLAAAPASQQAAMVGLTHQERVAAWGAAEGTRNGYGPVQDEAIRAFCQKNNLQLRDGGE